MARTASQKTNKKARKKAHVVACSSHFRQEIESLLRGRSGVNDNINIGDLARAVLLLIPEDVIRAQPDPGDPDPRDRDIVTLRGGKSAGRSMPRKPRLQLRVPGKHDAQTIRKALGLALSLEKGWANLALNDQRMDAMQRKADRAEAEVKRLQDLMRLLAFSPLPQGVKTRADALHVLGFAPQSNPSTAAIKSRYRALARIFHPDSNNDAQYGVFDDHERMSQLNDAVKILNQK